MHKENPLCKVKLHTRCKPIGSSLVCNKCIYILYYSAVSLELFFPLEDKPFPSDISIPVTHTYAVYNEIMVKYRFNNLFLNLM